MGLVTSSVLVATLAGCGGGGSSSAPTVAPTVTTTTTTAYPVAVPAGNLPIRLSDATPAATFAALKPVVKVGKVDMSGGAPVVYFSMADADDNPIIGFGSTSKSSTATVASYPNLAFALAKLVPGTNGSPSKWVSYIVTTVPTTTTAAAATRPSTDSTGTLMDNKNGTYAYTFYRDVTKIKAQIDAMTFTGVNVKDDLGDLSYDATAVHRLAIQVSGNAPGTGTNTSNAVQVVTAVPMRYPQNVIYDFIPASNRAVTSTDPSREITAASKCNECHGELGGIPGGNTESSGAAFHGGARKDPRFCVVCHTEQRKYGYAEASIDATNTFTTTTNRVSGRAVGNLPNHVHKIHMGKMLTKKNYSYGGLLYNEVGYPQDIRNCTKCHDGSDTSTAKTAQGNNWKTAPSRLACGSCHDGINYDTGKGVTLADAAKGLLVSPGGHGGANLAQLDDALCSTCHKSDSIDLYHLAVTPPNTKSSLHVNGGDNNTNAAWLASNAARLPTGAIKVTYDIKSVSRNTSKQPVMVFRILQNGARKDFNTASSAVTEMWDGFMGSPSAYFVFAVPQDGIAAPVDFNASASGYLRSIWNGTSSSTGKGTLSGPDTDGYYTVTLTGVTVPDNAVMLTGGLGYTYSLTGTMPLTQTNLADYPVAAAAATTGLTTGMPNKTGGLVVIAPNVQKVATGYTGRRAIVEDTRCNNCHQELGAFTDSSFHAGQRNDGSTCAWCHTPNRTSSGWSADSTYYIHAIHGGAKRSVAFNWHAATAGETFAEVKYPAILAQCETCHLPGTYDYSLLSSTAMANRPYRTVATGTLASTGTTYTYSPYITQDVNYGSGFSFSAATGVTTAAAATTLTISPIMTQCVSCHDTQVARNHMTSNGGSFYAPRSTALATPEQCLICHGTGRVADVKAMHTK